MTSFTIRVGDEVYVYVLGRLVMKRWIAPHCRHSHMFWGASL